MRFIPRVLIILVLLAVLLSGKKASAATYHVSKQGNNSDGLSVQTGWNELNTINWKKIVPGDAIVIEQGTYTTPLTVSSNGTPTSPIKIIANGNVEFFGGRKTVLPNCGQTNYTYQTALATAINLTNSTNIIIDGQNWRGIKIHGFNGYAIIMNGSANITLRNLEVYDNGTATNVGGTWSLDSKAAIYHPTQNTILDRLIIHDNAADAVQLYDNTKITMQNSWLYNSQRNGSIRAWNECTHPDGIQTVSPHTSTDMKITNSVFGPLLYHGIIMEGNSNNVTLSNVLFDHPTTSTLAIRSPANNWIIDHITAYRDTSISTPNVMTENLEITGGGSNVTISNSLFYGGSNNLYPQGATLTNNYRYNSGNATIGTLVNPSFKNPVMGGDFTPTASVKGAGSQLVSSVQLLAIEPSPTIPISSVPISATNTPSSTAITMVVLLHGIGKGGDNVNPNGTGTISPLHPDRQITLELFDTKGQSVLTKVMTLSFNTTTGNFQGAGSAISISTGVYTARINTPNYLRRNIPGIVSVTSGQPVVLPVISLVAGDSNNDNQLSILDYNLILDCFSDLKPASNCDAKKKLATDITDDGSVNQFDYNLFLRELSVQAGQ